MGEGERGALWWSGGDRLYGSFRGPEGGESLNGIEGERCRLWPGGDLGLLFRSGDRCLLDCPDSG